MQSAVKMYTRGKAWIQQANIHDIAGLVPLLRERDVYEAHMLERISGRHRNLETVFTSCFIQSTQCWALYRKSELEPVLLAVGGVGPVPGLPAGWGCPWLAGTRHLERYPFVLAGFVKYIHKHIQDIFPNLVNWTLLPATAEGRSIGRWLNKSGFSLRHCLPQENEGSGKFGIIPKGYELWLFFQHKRRE